MKKESDNAANTHETQSTIRSGASTETNTGFIDDQLLPLQKIEGGGPPNKIDLHSLPKPLMYFGFLLIVISIIMLFSIVYVSMFR